MHIRKCFIVKAGSRIPKVERGFDLTEYMTVFKDEEAARLLDYFISYKELINHRENCDVPSKSDVDRGVTLGVLPEPEELLTK